MSKRVLGLDYGSRRVGVAIGDTVLKIASPYEVITHDNDFDYVAQRLSEIINDENISQIIIGLPLALDGTETQQTHEIRSFIDFLSHRISVEIKTEDERLTTHHADHLVRDAGKKFSSDDVAAMLILQAYFERLS